jgi:polyhydroxybutyrate depolymerase
VKSLPALVLSALALGCVGSTSPARIEVEQRQVTVNGVVRSFLLLTDGLTPGQPRPLLLIYHGSGGSAEEIMNGTGIALKARDAGMIVASLDAVPGYGQRWATNPVDLPVADDVAFTRAAVDDIGTTTFVVDRSKIYAVGFSRGGDFVFQLACRANDLVRGVAAVGSTMLYTSREWCDAADFSTRRPGIVMALGSNDPLMPWAGGLSNRMGALETTNYWSGRFGCTTDTPAETHEGVRGSISISRFQYASCGNTDLRLYRLAPMAHTWPGDPLPMESMLLSWFSSLPAQPAARAVRSPSP